MPEVRRFHSPFGHWVVGLLFEIAVYGLFVAACALAAFLVATVF